MVHPKEHTIKWHNRLRFRALLFFIALSCFVILVTSTIMNIVSEKMTQYIAHEQLSHSRQKVLTALYKRTEVAATLVNSLSSIALELQANRSVLKRLTPSLIDLQDNQQLIAGGGIWPEPYAFDKNKLLDSYFWGRNAQGQLEFYNDYNDSASRGYHQEEWYVPAHYLTGANLYWSKSYTDPYSLQSMVTVTAPIWRDQQYLGAATIDLSLKGLTDLLKESTQGFNGYAFAMDRNGRLLSFPEDRLVNDGGENAVTENVLPLLTLDILTQKYPAFAIVKQKFLDVNNNGNNLGEVKALAQNLSEHSDQINLAEAYKISKSLLGEKNTSHKNISFKKDNESIFTIKNDNVLQAPALAIMTTMPSTGWHIITVMPESVAMQSSRELTTTTNITIAVSMFFAIILAWLLLKRIYVDPLERLTQQLKESPDDSSHEQHLITTEEKGELGVLAYWFNQRTRELLSSKEKVNSLAFYDPLTSLPNRRMLQNHLEDTLSMVRRTRTSGALMFLDLDHFKNLNDSLGHDVGDQLLIEVSKRISNCLRKNDVVARLGGDEFVVVLAGYETDDKHKTKIPEIIATKIQNSLVDPFLLADSYYHVTASIGIALFNHENDNVKNILKYADSAMYHSKAGGRNTFCFFEENMQVQADHRLRIENDLRAAIGNGELFLVYQPQVSSDGECQSVEALLRWKHPTEGFISPVDFIAIAEESMLILSLGKWVIENTCKQIKKWEQEGISFDHVAVNISPIQFRQPDFVDNIIKTICKYYLPPTCLMVEITEGVIIDNPDNVIKKILLLKKLGIRVSIDDFGTGYSSLTYLKQLPVDELKIDRSFVMEIENDHSDAVITETIIAMANNFGYEVIAEGVETQAQKDILLNKGCHFFQGYLFSKPLLPTDIPRFVKASRLPNEGEKLSS